MIRGFYTAASGLVTNEKKLNAYANNIANASTVGYKKDALIAGTFGENVTVRMNAYQDARAEEIGPSVYMQTVDSKYTDYTQGAFQATGRTVDLAIQGDGMFFVVQSGDGNESLTRNGQFAIDEEGYLTLPNLGRVMGVGGELQIGTSEFMVDSAGNIYVVEDEDDEEPVLIDRLLLAIPEDYDSLDKLENGTYTSSGYIAAEENDVTVRQGTLERSNVDMSEEMTRIIASQRSLQSCSQIVKMFDEMSDQIVNRISRI